jgi:hypothetical protein
MIGTTNRAYSVRRAWTDHKLRLGIALSRCTRCLGCGSALSPLSRLSWPCEREHAEILGSEASYTTCPSRQRRVAVGGDGVLGLTPKASATRSAERLLSGVSAFSSASIAPRTSEAIDGIFACAAPIVSRVAPCSALCAVLYSRQSRSAQHARSKLCRPATQRVRGHACWRWRWLIGALPTSNQLRPKTHGDVGLHA